MCNQHRRVIPTFTLLLLATMLGACTTTQTQLSTKDKNGCQYIERNLTVEWPQRTYWCVPGATKQTITTYHWQEGRE